MVAPPVLLENGLDESRNRAWTVMASEDGVMYPSLGKMDVKY
jgi:hypothetical protein